MIKFKNFNLKYNALNNPTIKNVNLEIKDGEKVLIVGPSGCGKSTLSKVLNGLIPNSIDASLNGEASIDDLTLGENSIFNISKKVGTILQDQDSQFVGINTGEDIAFFLENCNVEVSKMHEKVDEVLNKLEIFYLKNSKPSDLSGGQKQRVSIGGVLVNDVKYLLLDEPLANLDPKSALEIMNLIDKLNKEFNKTIIMIEHRLEDSFLIDFDRLIILEDGKIIGNDTPSNLLKTDVLTKIGIRKPLFIEALESINYDFSNIKNMLNYNEYSFDKNFLVEVNKKEIKVKEDVALDVKNLKFSYNKEREVLKDVSFKIHRGEMVALLGSNGSGKSTISSTILGLNEGYKGSISVNGESIDNLSIFERGQKVGYVMQNPNHCITENLVFDEVSFRLKFDGLSKAKINEKVEEILDVCGLLKYKDWPINMLSYGQKRRVTIASVLIKKPKVIILDEPTAGQDYDTFRSIINMVKTLSEKYDIGIVIITHNMQLAYEYCNRAIVLDEGEIVFSNTIDKLYENDYLINKASLRETSVQTFSKYHNLDSEKFGAVLKQNNLQI